MVSAITLPVPSSLKRYSTTRSISEI
ncbi:hypothetical protein CY0110_15927 [Crocosphaera chwakensis CCY0110]|uniref:Uncharacterized protein n=1 Tax=Crocosphaera chwakensis CCY0110 TaxID=391612 RepID=A3IHL7_9CHRO|nr:hypothetical protein CY0110_15927 [Crocosphaera chwakensis CCY0110]